METTILTIQLSMDVSRELDRKAKSRGRKSSDLAAEFVSIGLKSGREPKPDRIVTSSRSAAKLVDQTFGSARGVDRKTLVSLAEDEEFSGY